METSVHFVADTENKSTGYTDLLGLLNGDTLFGGVDETLAPETAGNDASHVSMDLRIGISTTDADPQRTVSADSAHLTTTGTWRGMVIDCSDPDLYLEVRDEALVPEWLTEDETYTVTYDVQTLDRSEPTFPDLGLTVDRDAQIVAGERQQTLPRSPRAILPLDDGLVVECRTILDPDPDADIEVPAHRSILCFDPDGSVRWLVDPEETLGTDADLNGVAEVDGRLLTATDDQYHEIDPEDGRIVDSFDSEY